MPVLNFRISVDEERRLRQAAVADGRTLSDYLRHAAGLAVRRRRRHPQVVDLALILAHLGRLAGCVNQLAFRCNARGYTPGIDALTDILAEIRQTRQAIEAALQ